jgi:hypothetical protein
MTDRFPTGQEYRSLVRWTAEHRDQLQELYRLLLSDCLDDEEEATRRLADIAIAGWREHVRSLH